MKLIYPALSGATFVLIYHFLGLSQYPLWLVCLLALIYGLGLGRLGRAYDRWCEKRSDESTS